MPKEGSSEIAEMWSRGKDSSRRAWCPLCLSSEFNWFPSPGSLNFPEIWIKILKACRVRVPWVWSSPGGVRQNSSFLRAVCRTLGGICTSLGIWDRTSSILRCKGRAGPALLLLFPLSLRQGLIFSKHWFSIPPKCTVWHHPPKVSEIKLLSVTGKLLINLGSLQQSSDRNAQ